MLELVNEDQCSTTGGTRRKDIRKMEAKLKEKETREITMAGYKYIIYWDKKQRRQKLRRVVED